MKEGKLINSSELNGFFTADHLISLGFKYQRGVAVPYEFGRSLEAAIENGDDNPMYDMLDTCLEHSFGIKPDDTVYIVLDK